MKISLVISVFNEEENIKPLIEKIDSALERLDYEVVFVDDGSKDNTINQIKEFGNSHYTTVSFYKNFGQTAAMSAGIEQASGDLIITLDGDLQNDPADIPGMVKKLVDEDWDVVAGRRAKRKDYLLSRKFPSKIANWIIRWLTGVKIHDYGCSLKVFRADVAKNLGLYGELHRFIPVLAQLQGAKITEVDVKHHPRQFGKTKYGIGRTFRVISDLMLMVFYQKFLQKPMHLFGTLGIFTFIIGMALNVYLLIEKFLGHDIWGRPVLILAITLTLGGIQLVTSGIIAEMIMRTYYESQDKKIYSIKQIFVGKDK